MPISDGDSQRSKLIRKCKRELVDEVLELRRQLLQSIQQEARSRNEARTLSSGKPHTLSNVDSEIEYQGHLPWERSSREIARVANDIERIAKLGHWKWNHEGSQMIWCSEQAASIYGLSQPEFLAMSGSHDEYLELVFPGDRRAVDAAVRVFYQNFADDPENVDPFELEYRIVTKDGEIRHVRERAGTAVDDQGAIVRSVGTIQDITEQKLAEEALVESESRLRTIIDNYPWLITLKDLEGRYLLVNEFYGKSRNKSVEQAIGKTAAQIETAEQAAIVDAHDQEVIEKGEMVVHERDVIGQDNARVTRSVIKFPAYDADGAMMGVGSISTDVTLRKRMEEELIAREAQLNLVTNNLPVLIAHFDKDQRFRFANRTAEEWYDLPSSDIIGKTVANIFGEEAYSKIQHRIEGVLIGETAVFEESLKYPDGKCRDVQISYVPDIDKSGDILGYFGLVVDLTAHNRVERQLRESEERLGQAVQLVKLGHCIWDILSDRCIFCSEEYANVHGVSPEEFIERSSAAGMNFVHPDDRDACRAAIQNLRQGAGFELEYRTISPDGEVRYVREIAEPRLDENGSVVQKICTIQDITERRQIEEQLRRAQKMEAVGQLTGGIAHDFNNILAIIIGHLGIFQDGGGIKDEIDRETIAVTLRAAHRGAELIDRLLAFSRQQPLEAKTTQINEILPQFCLLAESMLGEDITIELKLAADLWPAVVDVGQLENALLNLVTNARDAMLGGGKLTIVSANQFLEEDDTAAFEDLVPGDYVMIAVGDSGTGMEAEALKRAFEPFFTTKDVGEGSGLGLSMVFGFARQSGGQVLIDSKKDEGTTVRVYLPRTDAATDDEMATEASDKSEPTGRETILLVEDEKDVLAFIAKALNRLGYNVLQAKDGPAALEIMAASGAIDLLLTDVILPQGMSGRDVSSAFREQFPAAGVLYSSGYSRDILFSRGQLEDGVALMSKPYRTQILAQRVREVLDGRK
jgi:PAS domain S-box-containing protein